MTNSAKSWMSRYTRIVLAAAIFIAVLAAAQIALQASLRSRIASRSYLQVSFPPRYQGEPFKDRRIGGPTLVPEHLDGAVSAAIIASAVLVIIADFVGFFCWKQLHSGRKAVADAKVLTYRMVLFVTSAASILVTLALTLFIWIREYLNPVWNWIPTDPSASGQTFTLESWTCQVGQEITQVGFQNDCRIARAGRALTIPLFLSFVALAGMAVKKAREDGRTQPGSMPTKQVDSCSLDERYGQLRAERHELKHAKQSSDMFTT
ncbi:unnamed protein product [Zymoseptoria tritici ST99CH_1A5]|nr:unnamed protein product [Zymoseptoria tritici ST99CH_3D7]SMR55517.1 unnamed protein product [Zymoseptoria tritici ST99CH_1E4]SMR57893.1 unnamed protein product [Zymoseptoria tritici ST99CH_3D1]SMY26329.1 unnamed protein product [Zymoseptoria tritici ST99CH_1A5]